MSKAFTKEDVDPPDRPGRVRSASGLPPGAINYMTAEGARRLRALDRGSVVDAATIVPAPDALPEEVLFGTTVSVRADDGKVTQYRIVGVDETHLAPEWISWVSPLARALLGAQVGQRVHLPGTAEEKEVEVVAVAY